MGRPYQLFPCSVETGRSALQHVLLTSLQSGSILILEQVSSLLPGLLVVLQQWMLSISQCLSAAKLSSTDEQTLVCSISIHSVAPRPFHSLPSHRIFLSLFHQPHHQQASHPSPPPPLLFQPLTAEWTGIEDKGWICLANRRRWR